MRILVIDSDCFVLGSISNLCESRFPGASMVGARNAKFAVEECRLSQPDLVILEIDLRDGDGLELVPGIREVCPSVRILAFSSLCDRYTAHRIQQARLDGYLCKRYVGPDELCVVMRLVMKGERYFDGFITRRQAALRADPAAFTKLLSDRELEFLGPIGAGLSNSELAAFFEVSVSTANNHRASIMSKLGMRRSADLMRFAAENGFTRASPEFDSNKLRAVPIVGRRAGRPVPSESEAGLHR